jgi:hypothetical protein
MTPKFTFPDHWSVDSRSAAPQPVIDQHRIGHLVNGFIAGKQAALYEAADAFYRKVGVDALKDAPTVVARLNELRESALKHAGDDERPVLAAQLEAQLGDALDGINRHMAEQHKAFGREVLAERHRLIERAAALDHNNYEKLLGLAAANASAAQVLTQLNGEPEEPAMQTARSAVWRSAIGQHLEKGQRAEALGLLDRIKGELVSADKQILALDPEGRTDGEAK